MTPALKLALRVWGLHALLLLLSFLFVAGISNSLLTVLLGAALLLGFVLMAFNDGAYTGEKAATLSASIEKQRANNMSGRVLDDSLLGQVWKKETAVKALIIALIPFIVVATANLIAAPYYPEPVKTEVVEEAEPKDDDAFVYEDEAQVEAAPTNWFNFAARLVFMPYVFIYDVISYNALNWLFLLMALPMPLASFAGYMMGPRLREKKLKDIARGKRRKMRNLKVNKSRKGPKAEV